jgi:hypothetical protein
MSPSETASAGAEFFRAAEDAARSAPGLTPRGWVATLPGGLPSWQRFRIEPPRLASREELMDVVPFTAATLAHVTVPPVAGRLFGGRDTPQACRVAVVNDVAARDVFSGEAVGRSIDNLAGQRIEIVGVVASRRVGNANAPIQPTLYYYPTQIGSAAAAGPARFRVPARLEAPDIALDANVVSAGYFAAMGWTLEDGRLFADDPSGACRVAVVNHEAAERYFGGDAVGAAVIDRAGRRTEIIGVVRGGASLQSFQRRVEPAIYFPMAQDFLRGMTLILDARQADDAVLADLRRRLEALPGRDSAPVAVQTFDAHLSRTALAPSRIATMLVGVSAGTALVLGVLGLHSAMTESVRRRHREIAVRIALGAPGWRVIRDVVSEGARLATLGGVAGLVGSVAAARWLARVVPHDGPVSFWVWLVAPLALMGAVLVAGTLPAWRALTVDPIAITRDDT